MKKKNILSLFSRRQGMTLSWGMGRTIEWGGDWNWPQNFQLNASSMYIWQSPSQSFFPHHFLLSSFAIFFAFTIVFPPVDEPLERGDEILYNFFFFFESIVHLPYDIFEGMCWRDCDIMHLLSWRRKRKKKEKYTCQLHYMWRSRAWWMSIMCNSRYMSTDGK